MDLKALISAVRIRLDDLNKPFLWSDDEITLYLNEAEREAAERAQLIEDDRTPRVVEIALRANIGEYDLHESVLAIVRAKIDGQANPLTLTTRDKLDAQVKDWESETGEPKRFLDDEHRIVLYPIPTTAGVLRLRVKRLPIDPLDLAEKTRGPEIHERHHYRMIDWALRCAYLKPDADTFDQKRADTYEAGFTRSFGVRLDADVQRKQREKRTVKMKYGGL